MASCCTIADHAACYRLLLLLSIAHATEHNQTNPKLCATASLRCRPELVHLLLCCPTHHKQCCIWDLELQPLAYQAVCGNPNQDTCIQKGMRA
jgi:hypothetical protein